MFTLVPSRPDGPVDPVAPLKPDTPVAPVEPIYPVAPVVPFTPSVPSLPLGPVAPVTPVAPVEPNAPIKVLIAWKDVFLVCPVIGSITGTVVLSVILVNVLYALNKLVIYNSQEVLFQYLLKKKDSTNWLAKPTNYVILVFLSP
jgi:hypothetical protein